MDFNWSLKKHFTNTCIGGIMCQEKERCSFYLRYRNERREHKRRLVLHFCEDPKNFSACRRLMIMRNYNVDLAAVIGPAGDFLKLG